MNASIYDPQVEFLEIGVSVNGAKAWKVYGPDLNGRFGGLQGTGGLEATILDSSGTATGVLNDNFGNGVATMSGGSVTWNTTRVGGYGPLPGNVASPLSSITQLASAVSWRGHVIDPTGFYNLGARYYEPTSGRFLSADPMGHAASMSLYDFCNGDPVNNFDPDGRCADGSSRVYYGDTLQDRLNAVWSQYAQQVQMNQMRSDSYFTPGSGTVGDPNYGWVYGGYIPNEMAYGGYDAPPIPTWAVNINTGQVQNLPVPNYGMRNLLLPTDGTPLEPVMLALGGISLARSAVSVSGDMVEAALSPLSEIRISPFEPSFAPVSSASAAQLRFAAGLEWESDVVNTVLPQTQSAIQPQITITSNGPSGLNARLDAVGTQINTGVISLTDAKLSEQAPLTFNQSIVYPELETYGGVVAGKGKPPYVGGTVIPPTKVDIITPP